MTDRVLGTPLFAAADDAATVTFLVSDLHLTGPEGPVWESFRQLLAHAAGQGEPTRVLILGDLFHACVGPKQLRHGVVRSAAGALAATAAAGVSISVLHGNRDFMLEERFAAAAGCRVVPGGLRFVLGGRPALALHGDELCLNDRPYQRSKRILRSRAVRGLLRNLPLWAAEGLGRLARRASAASVARGDQERFHPTLAAVRAALETGADLLVFGHIHRPARGRLAGLGEYCILPAFDEDGVFLRHGPGPLEYQRLAAGRAETVPDPGARLFS